MSDMTATHSKAEFAALVCDTVRVANPQHVRNGEPGEAELARHVCGWLDAHGVPFTVDLTWGVHAVLRGPEGPGGPGVLLAAHLDSDHLRLGDLAGVRVDETGSTLVCLGEVGLDCKTGVAIALSVLARLQGTAGAWQ
eukprot:194275-Prymnesium_polylepis.1